MVLSVSFPCVVQDTRSLLVHQLLVKVVGWERIDIPVSVDKVGVFFREVQPSCDSDHDNLPELSKNKPQFDWFS